MKLNKRFSAIATTIVVVIVIVIVVVASVAGYALFGMPHSSTSNNTVSSSSSSSTSSASSSTTSVSSSSSSSSSSVAQSSSATSSSSSSTGSGNSNSTYSLPYDASTKSVRIFLAILTNASSEVNFNATNYGSMVIYVPVGSNLNITMDNLESLPHNLLLVQNTTDVPAEDVGTTGKVLLGIGVTTTAYLFAGYSKSSQSASYSNIAAGTYWLACGTRKHAASGLFVNLIVSSSVTAPYVVINKPVIQPSGFS